MSDLAPRIQFQQTEDAKVFRDLVANPAMSRAITYAFAQFGLGPVTPDELNGARKFLSVFTMLAEPDSIPVLPPKELKTYA